jgi:hypothetical protein
VSFGRRRRGAEDSVGVDISDLGDRSRAVHANWWQWRPTVELIGSLGLFDDERLDHLSDGFGEFTQSEARQLAAALKRQVLPALKPSEQILIDGAVTADADDGTFHRAPGEQHRNYSADHEWLVRFIAFCEESDGLYVC